jgi:hypothetical protein
MKTFKEFLNEELTKVDAIKIIDRLDKKGFVKRKPETWKEATSNPVPPCDDIEELFNNYDMPEYKLEDIITKIDWPLDYFKNPMPRIFSVPYEDGYLVVNTEGADYMRYIMFVPKETIEELVN